MTGNPDINGVVLVREAAGVRGAPDIDYDPEEIRLKARASYPWEVKIWQEL